MARDIVSATVRLNFIGPMSSVAVLVEAQRGAVASTNSTSTVMDNGDGDDDENLLIASFAPIIVTTQPNHGILGMRLFWS
jgi:ApbE superfamily uncharacterized protein (UPF0280 family)